MLPAPEDLRPGDFLLYRGKGPASLVIKAVTASVYTHVEQYDGGAMSWASRDGIGVDRYPLRYDDLALAVRFRESAPFSMAGARRYWVASIGKGYDWIGLAISRVPRWQGGAREEDKEFCSEAATRAARFGIAEKLGLRYSVAKGMSGQVRDTLKAMGYDPFNGKNADGVYPGMFADCPFLEEVTR